MRNVIYYSIALAVLGGCGEGDEGPVVHPVSGKVLVNGKPAAKAQVSFHARGGPAGGAPPPMAITEEDGTFRPSTRYAHDGAPVGDYALTVIWPKMRVDHGEEVAGPDQLRGKYSDPGRSGLKVTIKEGENTLPPLELKTSR